MKKIRIKKIGDAHGTGRVWMAMLPNKADWWLHLYLHTFDEACAAVNAYFQEYQP